MLPLIQFAFILAVPLVAVAGAVVTLFAIGAVFDAMENPDDLRMRIDAIFRPPLAKPTTPGAKHYYRAFWKSS